MNARDALVELEDLIGNKSGHNAPKDAQYRKALEPFVPVWIAMMQAPAAQSGETIRGGDAGKEE